MAYTTGIAGGPKDLLTKVTDWLVTQGWVGLFLDNATGTVWLKGIGAGAGRPVVIGFQLDGDSWRLRATTSYDAAHDFDSMPLGSPTPYFNLWGGQIQYWIIANDRRVIVIAQCGTAYIGLYAGFFLPFATPQEYSFPLYIGGNYGVKAEYNIDNAGNRMLADPGRDSAYYLNRGTLQWSSVYNSDYGVGESADYSISSAFLYPSRTSLSTLFKTRSWEANGFGQFVPNAQDELPLFPSNIFDRRRTELVGALDGVYRTPGSHRVPGQEVTAHQKIFIYFPNIHRHTNHDFMAVGAT